MLAGASVDWWPASFTSSPASRSRSFRSRCFPTRYSVPRPSTDFLPEWRCSGRFHLYRSTCKASWAASATRAGSVLTPILLGWVTFSVIAGRLLLRVGYRSTVIAGMVLLAIGFFFLTRIGPSTSATYITLDMLAVGAGMGLSMLTLLIAVQNAVPRDQLGIATSSTQFFRSIGGIVGVAVMGSVLSSHLSAEVERIVQTDGGHQELAELARHPDIIINAAARARIPPSILQDFTTALDHALHSVFLVGLVVAILALFSAFLVPKSGASLGNPPGIENAIDPLSPWAHQPLYDARNCDYYSRRDSILPYPI